MKTLIQQRLETVMPKSMRTLQRDVRGYPIPFIVLRDKSGTPQFTINDHNKTIECRRKALCAICGKRLVLHRVKSRIVREAWFVGGSRCFLHDFGAFLDPPAHYDCAVYALQVCPFLAARSYSKRIDASKLKPEDVPADTMLVVEDFMMPRLPERFGLGVGFDYNYRETSPGRGVYTVAQWQYVEWWQAGVRVNAPDTGVPPPNPD